MSCGCGCQQSIGGVDAGVCDQFFSIATASSVEAFKVTIDAAMLATNEGVKSCSGLDAQNRALWVAFMADWKTFRVKEASFWTDAGAQWNQCCTYARTLDGWREKLTSVCGELPGPQTKGADTSAVKWIAAAVIVAAVVVGVRTVMR